MSDEKKRQELSKARQEYLANREQLLQKKVDSIALLLFDRLNEDLLKKLELSPDGTIKNNSKNINAVAAIESIYDNFNKKYNIPVIKSFIEDMPMIGSLNQQYFDHVAEKETKAQKKKADRIVNDQLGIDSTGNVIKGGFTDKFIKDPIVKDSIKQKTLEAISQGKGFQEFRKDLQQVVRGVPKQNNGKLHQYYRNNAYDTYTKVDRTYSDSMAKDLKLNYFVWSGGVINTTRALCRHMNGKIVNAVDFAKMKFRNLKLEYRPGVPDGKHSTWRPLLDLGGYACRHTKDYVSTQYALAHSADIVSVNTLTISAIKTQEKPPTVDKVMKIAKKSAPELDRQTLAIANKNNAFTTPVNLKSKGSIERKLKNEYAGDITKLKDAVRTTIIADPDKVDIIIEDLKNENNFIRVKSQKAETDPLGYSGNIVHLQSASNLVMEVQVNSPKIIYAKEKDAELILGKKLFEQIKNETGLEHGLGHHFYEEYRVLNPMVKEEAEKMKKIAEESRAYYNKFR